MVCDIGDAADAMLRVIASAAKWREDAQTTRRAHNTLWLGAQARPRRNRLTPPPSQGLLWAVAEDV